MSKEEIRTLWGSLLILVGAFTPWHSFAYGYPFEGIAPNSGSGSILGIDLAAGRIVAATAVIVAILTLWPRRQENEMRVVVARQFANYLIVALISISGVAPVFTHWNVGGHIGLALGLVGSFLVFISSRRALRSINSRDEE